MKLIKGENKKDCMGAAFAMATNTSLAEVQKFCKHDGAQGYTSQEMTDYTLSKNYAAVSHFGQECYTTDVPEINLPERIINKTGVIGFKRKDGETHAVATDGTTVYDPKGCTYSLDYLFEHGKILIFWQLEKVCACKTR